MYVTELLTGPEQDVAAGDSGDPRRSAITVDLYPMQTRVITQKMSEAPAEHLEAFQQPAGSWRSSIGYADARGKALGPGSVLRQRYFIESRIGSGGMGSVFKAVDVYRRGNEGVDSHVAIKVLHERTHNHPEVLEKLRREFYCAQALSHRSVVKVYDLDRDGALDFFTMEWLDGELLSAVLKQFPHRLPRPAAWAILREIAAGLEHAHGRNVVHADLKPQNIMVTKTGEVRIMDFGASSGSARGDSGGQRSKSMAVTPAYASCELLAGRAPDLRDDVFALACLSYELLAGAHPFDYRRATEAREAGIVPQRPPDLSSRQWRALQQGLAWERQDRPISVNDWLEALKPGEGELQGIPRPELDASGAPVKPRAPKILPETYPRLIAGLAALLLVLIGWALWHQPAEPASALPAATFSAPASVPGPPPASVPGPPAGTSFPADEPVKADATPAVAEPAAAEVRTPVPAQSTGPVPRHARAAEHRGPVVDQIGISASAYRVRPDMRFAEIRVQRSIASNARSSFVWWTEDGTGVAGIDYVRQGRSTAYFAPGSLTATLFVKVLANEARQQAATFSVIIGNPTDGAALGNSKARITLLPTRS